MEESQGINLHLGSTQKSNVVRMTSQAPGTTLRMSNVSQAMHSSIGAGGGGHAWIASTLSTKKISTP